MVQGPLPSLPMWWWSLLLPQDNIGACPYSVLPVFSPVFFTQFSRPYLGDCFYSWNILLPVKLKYPRIRFFITITIWPYTPLHGRQVFFIRCWSQRFLSGVTNWHQQFTHKTACDAACVCLGNDLNLDFLNPSLGDCCLKSWQNIDDRSHSCLYDHSH